MSRELIELILPRLSKRLNRHLRHYKAGRLDDAEFSKKFEALLEQQHSWLANKGFAEVDAAVAVHGAVLVLSAPGLKAEAVEQSVPLEVIEYRAVRAAAADIAEHYGMNPKKAVHLISELVATYTE